MGKGRHIFLPLDQWFGIVHLTERELYSCRTTNKESTSVPIPLVEEKTRCFITYNILELTLVYRPQTKLAAPSNYEQLPLPVSMDRISQRHLLMALT
jgi:hypothetical protein